MARPPRRDETIQIRTSAETKAVLIRAAELRGQKLSEFILDSARRQADEAILDQRVFLLDPKQHEQFLTVLDALVKPDAQLKARMRRQAAWEA